MRRRPRYLQYMNPTPIYTLSTSGIYIPPLPVQHRDEEYQEDGFETLRDMQGRHFWYRGRHRFLLAAVNRYLPKSRKALSAIDLGGGLVDGCGI